MNYMTIQLVAHRTMLHVIKILPIKLLARQMPLSSVSDLHLQHVQNCDAFRERIHFGLVKLKVETQHVVIPSR